MGTPDYVAPEQALNSRQADIRSDLYSLGCTFYHLLSGQPPFPGGTLTEKLLKHQLEQPMPVERFRPEVPEWVVLVVRKLMAKRPEARYQTPRDLAADLEALASGKPFRVVCKEPFSPPPLPPPPANDPGPDRTEALATLARPRRPWYRRGKVLSLAGAGLLTALTLLLLLPRPRPAERPQQQRAVNVLDRLDALGIPEVERYPWQPKELVAVLGEHRGRHQAALAGLAISADGQKVVSIGIDWSMWLWDAPAMRCRAVLPAAGSMALFSPDRRILATAFRTTGAILWDLSGPQPTKMASLPLAVPLAFSLDGKRLATCDGKAHDQVELWDLAGGKPVRRETLPGSVEAAAFGRDGDSLITCDLGAKNLRVWRGLKDLKDLKKVELPLPRGPLGAEEGAKPTFSCAGTKLILQGKKSLTVWDLAPSQPKLVARVPRPLSAADITPDGLTLIGRTNQGRLLQCAAVRGVFGLGVEVQESYPTNCLALSADGRTLATGYSAVRLWQVGKHLEERLPLRGPIGPVLGLTFLPDGRSLAAFVRSQPRDWVLWRWDLEGKTAKQLVSVGLIDAAAAVFSPDGKLLAVPQGQGITLLDPLSGKPRGRLNTSASLLAFSADSRTLAGRCPDGSVQLWDISRPSRAKKRQRLTVGGSQIALSPAGKRLACAVGIYDVSTGKQIRPLKWDGHIAFSPPDGQLLALSGRPGCPAVCLAEARTRKTPQTLPPFGSLLCFSPDGRHLAWTINGQVYVADLDTGRRLQPRRLPFPVLAMAFAADNRHLALGNANGTVYILRLPGGEKRP
jgi:WD40 repeat protein